MWHSPNLLDANPAGNTLYRFNSLNFSHFPLCNIRLEIQLITVKHTMIPSYTSSATVLHFKKMKERSNHYLMTYLEMQNMNM